MSPRAAPGARTASRRIVLAAAIALMPLASGCGGSGDGTPSLPGVGGRESAEKIEGAHCVTKPGTALADAMSEAEVHLGDERPAVQVGDEAAAVAAVSPDLLRTIRDASPRDVLPVGHAELANPAVRAALLKSRARLIVEVADGADAAVVGASLNRPIQHVSTVAVLPGDAGTIRAVHGAGAGDDAVLGRAVRQYAEARAAFAHVPGVEVISDRGPTAFADHVLQAAQRRDAGDLLVVVAHNDGERLRGPDGTGVTMAAVADALHNSGRPGLVISCETVRAPTGIDGSVSITKRLEPEVVALAMADAQGRLAGVSDVTFGRVVDQFAASLDHVIAATDRRRKVKVVLVVGGAAGVVAVTVYVIEEQGTGVARV